VKEFKVQIKELHGKSNQVPYSIKDIQPNGTTTLVSKAKAELKMNGQRFRLYMVEKIITKGTSFPFNKPP